MYFFFFLNEIPFVAGRSEHVSTAAAGVGPYVMRFRIQ